MSNTKNSLPVGEIRFLDNSIPALDAGVYKIEAEHNVKVQGHGNSTYPAMQLISVQGPRFRLPSTAIHSQFPPPGSKSDYSTNLPFITLNGEQLPWMRELEGANTDPRPGWLALLLFKDDGELIYDTEEGENESPTKITLRTLEQILMPEDGIIGPDIDINHLEPGQEAQQTAYTIDLNGKTFNTLVPRMEELPFLVHLRQINSGLNAIDGLSGNGFYPIIVSNRMPRNDDEETVKYIAHLVSLEGFGKHLPGGDSPILEQDMVRMVSLQSWNFESQNETVNFADLVENLDKGPIKLDFDRPLSWDLKDSKLTTAQSEVKKRYEEGYVAINSTTRLGEETFSWYRGPLVPNVPDNITNTDPSNEHPLTTADEALVYDPTTGVFDQSYAAAWQTGRLTTLANKGVSRAIYEWKKKGIELLKLIDTLLKEMPQDEPVSTMSLKIMVNESSSGKKKFTNYLAGPLGRKLSNKIPGSGRPIIPIKERSGLLKHLNSMPGILDPDKIDKSISANEDPHLKILNLLRDKKSAKH
jgi:hypothetical protein